MAQELKDYDIMDIEAIDDERVKASTNGRVVPATRVYIKEDADKVIAELKAQAEDDCAYWKTMAQKNAEDNAVMAKQRAEAFEREQHHKYKRCLAMAMRCGIGAQFQHNNAMQFDDPFYIKRAEWLEKWRNRWREIADKFKEACV